MVLVSGLFRRLAMFSPVTSCPFMVSILSPGSTPAFLAGLGQTSCAHSYTCVTVFVGFESIVFNTIWVASMSMNANARLTATPAYSTASFAFKLLL